MNGREASKLAGWRVYSESLHKATSGCTAYLGTNRKNMT